MSDLATYQQWIEPGFAWLDENWAHEQSWHEVRGEFLAVVGVSEEDLATPACRVLGIVVHRLDALADDNERRELVDAGGRFGLVSTAFAEWRQETGAAGAENPDAAAPAAAADEPQWVDGQGWMRYDAATEQWVNAEAPAADAAPGSAAAEKAAENGETQYVEGRGWMRFDPATGQWADIDGPAAPAAADAAVDAAAAPPAADAAVDAAAAPPAAPTPDAAAAPAAAAAAAADSPARAAADAAVDAAAAAPPAPDAAAAPAGPDAAEAAPAAPPAPDAAPAAPAAEHAPDAAPAAPAAEHAPDAAAGAPPPEPAPVEVGASDPVLAAAVAELPQETQELFTEAVQEELAPVIEEVMGSIEGLEDLSPEDIEAAFAAAVAEAGLAGAAETS